MVRVNETLLAPCLVTSGVVDGNFLDSPLFLMYFGKMFRVSKGCVLLLLAGDLKIVYDVYLPTLRVTFDKIPIDLLSLDTWCAYLSVYCTADESNVLESKYHAPQKP